MIGFEGWGTALKPGYEPIAVFRKPLDGTVAQNVLKWGTGGMNIDACRVDAPEGVGGGGRNFEAYRFGENRGDLPPTHRERTESHGAGRWPANLIHDGSDEVVSVFPISPGALADVPGGGAAHQHTYNAATRKAQPRRVEPPASAARFFYCAKASQSDRDEGFGDFETVTSGDMVDRTEGSAGMNSPRAGAGRTAQSGRKNPHNTVKPTMLMRYLCKLVTPPGGTVLDGFAGSCSTGKAAVLEGFQAFMVEKDPTHARVGDARMLDAERRWRNGLA